MGGLVATLATIKLQPKVAGLILFSAMIDVKRTLVMSAQEAIAGILNMLMPEAAIVPGRCSCYYC